MTQSTYVQSGTTLFKRKKIIKVSKKEALMILQAYLEHATNWASIVKEVKKKADILSVEYQELYQSSTTKQLKDRMSAKFGKLLLADRSTLEAFGTASANSSKFRGIRPRIYYENAGDNVTLTLYNVTLPSQKPC